MRSVTHELRSPVNGTLNYLEAALSDNTISEKTK